jgi:hypothetical protein
MNKQTVAILVAVVALVVAVPLLGQFMALKTAVQSKGKDLNPGVPVKIEPPYWTNENLVGTIWTGSMQGISATITLKEGGVAVASSGNMAVRMFVSGGTLAGTWSVDGDKITISADVPQFGKKTITGKISGKQFLDDKNVPLPLRQIQ